MTSGSVSLKNFSWTLKSKKRHRSGSGGSKDHEAKKKSFISKRQSTPRRGSSTTNLSSSSSGLEILAPVTADVEFKFTWSIEGFLKRVKNADDHGESNSSNGMDSDPFDISVNGVHTTWNLSIRFWTGEDGQRLANPFVLCLNLRSCQNLPKPLDVGVRFRFGVFNRASGTFEMCTADVRPDLHLENTNELRSVGYRNMAISDKHVNALGDVKLTVRLRLLRDDADLHSLASDMKQLLGDETTADVVLEAGNKHFLAHKCMLSTRSKILAELLKEAKKKDDSGKLHLFLPDIRPEILRDVLTYIYTGSSADSAADDALLVAADRFGLSGLKNSCERRLGEVLSPSNVASALLLAERHQCSGLKKSALSYCKDNHTYIMKDDDWKTIEEERPELFEEAVSEVVAKSSCASHTECLKKKGKRYEIEKNSSLPQVANEKIVEHRG